MFSKSCEYAIRALIFICSGSEQKSILKINDIAAAIDAPAYYTSKILQQLSKVNMIGSLKGPNGGFFIGKEHLHVKLIDVVNAIDGDKIFNGCALGLAECSEEKPCPLHDEFKRIRDEVKQMLQSTSIEMLASTLVQGKVLNRN